MWELSTCFCPRSPLASTGSPRCHQLARAYVRHLLRSPSACLYSCFSLLPPLPAILPPAAPKNARVTVAVTSVGRGPPRNMLRPFDMFVRGFGDERYHVLREEHLAGGKGYSIRIPPEPEPCAEFLPSDKSRQQVTVKREGRGVWRGPGGEGRAGALTQSCLRGMEHFVKDGPLQNGLLSFSALVPLISFYFQKHVMLQNKTPRHFWFTRSRLDI